MWRWVPAHRWPNRGWSGCQRHHAWCEATFCYLGDILCSGGGCDSAIAASCCVAWGKLRKLLPVLTTRHLSLRLRGKVYEACVRSTMPYGSEHGDQRNAKCGCSATMTALWSVGSVESKTETKHPQLHSYWNLASRTWHRFFAVGDSYGMVSFNGPRPVSNLSQTFHYPAPERKEGLISHDIDTCGLASINPLDRDAWRAGVWHSPVLRTPLNGTRRAP